MCIAAEEAEPTQTTASSVARWCDAPFSVRQYRSAHAGRRRVAAIVTPVDNRMSIFTFAVSSGERIEIAG